MASEVVILIRSNPRDSHRPAEGIRIALGFAACDHSVDLILSPKAARMLTEDLADCVDGEITQTHLSTLKEFIPTIYIEKERGGIVVPSGEYQTTIIDLDDISKKIAAAKCFVLF
mgnify:CR=1 FL=1